MFEGETVASGAPMKCKDGFAGKPCPGADGPKVLRSGGGWYIGFWCNLCGPYSRESGYYGSEPEAAAALQAGGFERKTGYKPGQMKVVKL